MFAGYTSCWQVDDTRLVLAWDVLREVRFLHDTHWCAVGRSSPWGGLASQPDVCYTSASAGQPSAAATQRLQLYGCTCAVGEALTYAFSFQGPSGLVVVEVGGGFVSPSRLLSVGREF